MNRVAVKPELVRWARERSGRSAASLSRRFPKLGLWERGEAEPTFRQLESFANATFVPVGYLFLPEPPTERPPVPDLRTAQNRRMGYPSPDLLDTIYLCQRRQAWYREFARSAGEEPHEFIGSARLDSPIERTAEEMRRSLHFDLEARRELPTWTEALRRFVEQADAMGVLVMCSGVALNNNRRRLDPDEFRGLALADDLAPLVFINGADTKAAQMFTLAHELAHLWLGESALSDVAPASVPLHEVEVWCNRVAAELLVPADVLRQELSGSDPLEDVSRLACRFKVSTLVVLRRLLDVGSVSRQAFAVAYDAEIGRLRERRSSGGGDFYLTQAARVSRRFARAVVASTLEGQTLYRDAFRMLGTARESAFREFGRALGDPDPLL